MQVPFHLSISAAQQVLYIYVYMYIYRERERVGRCRPARRPQMSMDR